MPTTLSPGHPFPQMSLARLGGGEVALDGTGEAKLIVAYRGQHCPMCKGYLGTLESLRAEYADAGITVVAISADSESQAQGFMDEIGYTGVTGYGMTEAQMQSLGLYISAPRATPETDHIFPEPGLFHVDDAGILNLVDISTAPFMRPDLASVLNGIKFTKEKGFPIRGRHGL